MVKISEFGIKINNFLSGVLYSYNLGLRDRLDCKPAMLTNSLFTDFLKENGLRVKGESTRDVICIEFTCGSKSFKDEIKESNSRIKDWQKAFESGRITKEEKERCIQFEYDLQHRADAQKEKYVKKTSDQIRLEWYRDGVSIKYNTYNKSGKIIKTETIHYKMLYRTAGKAKKGSCMFIRDKLYDKAHNFLTMGIDLSFEHAPIVEMGAYSSLITSNIVDRIQIKPEQILVIDDIDSFFITNVVSIETDKHRRCHVIHKDNYKLKNTMFDGQALIDSSIFPDWGNGYILLRHHMCKMAAFNSNIQLFFKDYYGKDYETATIIDRFGNKRLAKDIKLITTENAMKWLTFGVSYDYWLKWLKKNDYMFGIVKTAHESKFGKVQRMSYQMVNALDINTMDSVLECSKNFIDRLKNDDEFFLQYLKDNINFSNDYEVLVALCEHNTDFINCDFFRERRYNITNNYLMELKIGKLIQPADNLVIVGSPYAMLLAAVGEDVEKDDTFKSEDDCIQCFTEMFKDNETLAAFRSPFNGRANMNYLHNVYNDKLFKYFNLGKQIIAVNMNHTPFQDKNNGSDQDSDSLYVTNQEAIVECAKYCYNNYPTIVNNIPKEKNIYNNTPENFARIDNNLASYQNAIGVSSNLAQICLTYSYNFPDKKYEDYVCLLSVLAQIAIDNAKRSYDIDLNKEINAIKLDMDIDKHKYPLFYSDVQNKKRVCIDPKKKRRKLPAKFNKQLINHNLRCPMNCINKLEVRKKNTGHNSVISIEDLIISHKIDERDKRHRARKVEELIDKYSMILYEYNTKQNFKEENDEHILLRIEFEKMINEIRSIKLSGNYKGLISWLLDRGFRINNAGHQSQHINSKINKNRALLIKSLYTTNPKAFLECFIEKKRIDEEK